MSKKSLLSSAVLLVLLGAWFASSAGQKKQATPVTAGKKYTYHGDVFPILQSKCQPCHFPGGKVFMKLPFDDSVTVASLSTKLNTRLKEKGDQAVINAWSSQPAKK